MLRHLQLTLIGAAILATLANLAGIFYWVFAYLIPANPFVGGIAAALLAWGIGLYVTDNMK